MPRLMVTTVNGRHSVGFRYYKLPNRFLRGPYIGFDIQETIFHDKVFSVFLVSLNSLFVKKRPQGFLELIS